MIDIINAAVSGNSSTNSRRPEGVPETPQANIRQNPQAQQPQVQPPASPQQTQQAVRQPASNDGVALLNNREQAAASAIQQSGQQASTPRANTQANTPDASAQRIQVDTDPVVQPQQGSQQQSTQAALENAVEINTRQQPTNASQAQQLVNAAQSSVENVSLVQTQSAQDPSVADRAEQRQAQPELSQSEQQNASFQRSTPEPTVEVQNANEQTFEARAPEQASAGLAPQAQPPISGQGNVQAQQQADASRQAQQAAQGEQLRQQEQQAAQQSARPVQPQQQAQTQQVGFGAQEAPSAGNEPAAGAVDTETIVGDILRPDFNQFVGLRASVPASEVPAESAEASQSQSQGQSESANESEDTQPRERVDFEA